MSKMEKDKLVEENSMLNNRIQELEKQLKRAKADGNASKVMNDEMQCVYDFVFNLLSYVACPFRN